MIKPNMLCYLSSACVAEGVIVEVIEPAGEENGFPVWHCKSRVPIPTETTRSKRQRLNDYFFVEQRYLRPILPPESDEQEIVSEPIKEFA